MSMSVARLALAVAVATAATGASALAPDPNAQGRAAITKRLVGCRNVADSAARLACYDQAAAALELAESKGDIVVVDREQARAIRRQAFGFSLPSISLFDKGEAREETDTVTGVIASARASGLGKWTVTLEDGAVWTQIDSIELARTPKAGMAVKIRRASLGSFLMTVDKQRAFRARRVE